MPLRGITGCLNGDRGLLQFVLWTEKEMPIILHKDSSSQRIDRWQILRDQAPAVALVAAGKELPGGGAHIHAAGIFYICAQGMAQHA